MFTKIDMHRVERIVSDNPLVTCSFVMSVADDNGKLNNVSRFEFHNYNTGQILKIIGGRKKDFLEDLKLLLENRESEVKGNLSRRNIVYEFGDRKTEINYTHRGYRHVLTHGSSTYVTTERLKYLVTLLESYMSARLPWIREGYFDTSMKLTADQTAEDISVRFIRLKDSKNQPMAISLEVNPDDGRRVTRFLNGVSNLVLTDYSANEKETSIKKVLERMSNTLLHILNYDQKSHAIDLFTNLDDVSPEILTYKGYVALSQDAKFRRVAMNFDQNIMCSKAHWIHERQYTKEVQKALSEIISLY